MAAHLVIQTQSENSALSMLERASTKLELRYARSQLEDLQDAVEQVCRDQKPEYCAVVGPEGSYLAHSTSNQIGRPAGELAGDRQQWGVIQCVTYLDERGRTAREYRMPLRHGEQEFGELRMGTRYPSPLAVIVGSGHIMPIACLGPIALLAVGAVGPAARRASVGRSGRAAAASGRVDGCFPSSAFQSACPRSRRAGLEPAGQRSAARDAGYGFRGPGGRVAANARLEPNARLAQQLARRHCRHERAGSHYHGESGLPGFPGPGTGPAVAHQLCGGAVPGSGEHSQRRVAAGAAPNHTPDGHGDPADDRR